MKSKKQLFNVLSLFFNDEQYKEKGLDADGISNETYGRKSCIYVDAKTPETRRKLESDLIVLGFIVNKDYWPGSASAEVYVSYFKGHNWNV